MTLQPTLVIADDDPDHSNLLAAWLERRGYRVICFDSGDDLVGWAASRSSPRVDAFLLDLEMPGRDGLSSCRELRRMGGYTETPALLVSGARMDGIAEQAVDAGVTEIVRKDPEMLQNLNRWLDIYLPASRGGR
ncbi:MAG TPA: response regulator [Longimicrobiaceae bacterium]|nr:response regulator [Longimicrobiaceae bacterium]